MSTKLTKTDVSSHAFISEDKVYRYHLSRTWDLNKPSLRFIMLNPSTADAVDDDPTIRRCVGFAQRFGNGGIEVVNLYGLRSTDPRALWYHKDPVGPENDSFIRQMATETSFMICAWGNNAPPARAAEVVALLRANGCLPMCFGVTKQRQPRHPLYLSASTNLEELK